MVKHNHKLMNSSLSADKKPTKPSVLLIEDDRDQIAVYKFKFEKEGWVFLSARHGREGLALAKSKQPDVVLIDLVLIKESGLDVLKQLKQEKTTTAIPAVILTNLATGDMKQQSQKLGAVDFIVKTQIDPSELVKRVKNILLPQPKPKK